MQTVYWAKMTTWVPEYRSIHFIIRKDPKRDVHLICVPSAACVVAPG